MTGSINPPIPTLGELNASEDIDIRDSLIDLRDAINDVLTPANTLDGATLANLSVPAAALAAGVSASNLGTATVVATLPVTPIDGQVCVFQNAGMATNGEAWLLRYRDGGAAGKKWEFVGGSPLFAQVAPLNANNQNTVSDSMVYQDLFSSQPAHTLPLAGDYDLEIGCNGFPSVAGHYGFASPKLGAAATADADGLHIDQGGGSGVDQSFPVWTMRRKTGLASGAVVKMQFRCASANNAFHFFNVTLKVTPVRVG